MYMVFESIIENIIEALNITNKIDTLIKVCDKFGLKKCQDNIKTGIKQFVYNITIECVVDYFHYLKKENYIEGMSHEERTNFFVKYMNDSKNLKLFFDRYTDLSDRIILQVMDIMNLQMEIIDRYNSEKDYLEKIFGVEGEITSIDCAMGDLHDGKTVCIVNFENGRIIYKPRDSFLDIMYNEILHIVAKNMKTIVTVNRKNYSWHEFISYKECDNIRQVHKYFYKAGIHLAIFYALGSSDIHYENIIANGENPIFIDLETLMHGVINSSVFYSNFKGIHDSVIATGLLPFSTNDGIFDFNISGLFTKSTKSKKIKQYFLQESGGEEDWKYQDRFVTLNPEKNIVKYKGKIIKSNSVEKDIISGFTNATRRIIEKKEDIVLILKKYAKNGTIVRQLLRPTYVYHKFIVACSHPDILMHPEKKDEIYDVFLNNFESGKFGYLRVLEEISEMKKGYIPSFYTPIGSKQLFSNGKIICEDYFECSPLDTAVKKIMSIDDTTLDIQIRYIKMSLASLNETSNLIQGTRSNIEEIYWNKADIDAQLTKYMEYLTKQLIEIKDNNLYLNILVPDGKKLVISPYSYDLYYSLGIIWLMYEYAEIYDINYMDYAKRMLGYAVKKYKTNIEEEINIDYSLFSGVGGLAYILYNIYKLTGDEYYKKLFKFTYKNIYDFFITRNLEYNDLDYMTGLSGTLYLLQKVSIEDESLITNQDITKLENKYISLVKKIKTWKNIGMAHGISGVCLPLSIIVNKDKADLALLEKLITLENNLISARKLKYTWCRGYTGLMLARNMIAETICDSNLDELLWKSLPSINDSTVVSEMLTLKNMSICHGVYGNIDILLCLGEKIQDKKELYRKYFKNLLDIKWIQNTNYSWDNFMLGNSGVAYVLMRMYNRMPSLLKLELYKK